MTRPALEVADILRVRGDHFLDRYRSSFDFQQRKAFRAIQRCRTAALGGHVDVCSQCGRQEISYNSCRNRNCPKCQTQARQRWLAAREQELLPPQLLPCGVHRTARTECAGLGQPSFVLRSVVHCQRSDLTRSSRRSSSLGSGDRRDQHLAHLGTEPAAPSSYSLRHSRWWPIAEPQALDPLSRSVLLTCENPQSRLSRKISGRSQTPVPKQGTPLRWPIRHSG